MLKRKRHLRCSLPFGKKRPFPLDKSRIGRSEILPGHCGYHGYHEARLCWYSRGNIGSAGLICQASSPPAQPQRVCPRALRLRARVAQMLRRHLGLLVAFTAISSCEHVCANRSRRISHHASAGAEATRRWDSGMINFWAVCSSHDRGFFGRAGIASRVLCRLIGLTVCSPFLGSSNVNL